MEEISSNCKMRGWAASKIAEVQRFVTQATLKYVVSSAGRIETTQRRLKMKLFVGRAVVAALSLLSDISIAVCAETSNGETERAARYEREANVVVYYDTGKSIKLERPKNDQPFNAESHFLQYLTERKGAKRLLVVRLSKRHEWSDPNQTIDGFWKACQKTGFGKVVILEETGALRNPIVRE